MAALVGVSGSQLPMIGAGMMAGMARGDHPMRTPVYGGLLVVTAMVGASVVWVDGGGLPGWLRTLLLVLAIPVAVVGWLLTFRDATPSSRRRR